MNLRCLCKFSFWEIFVSIMIILFLGREIDGFEWLELQDSAELYPDDDLRLFVGESMKVTCGLKESAPISSASDIYFIVEHDKNGEPMTIELNSTVVNSTHAFTYFKGTEEIKGRGTLLCLYKQLSPNNNNQLTSATFFVQERLQNVTNFSSVWDYPSKTFELSWNLGADYFDLENNIEVRTTWTPYSNSSKEGINICSNSNETYCKLDDFIGQLILNFHIIVQVKERWKTNYNKHKEYLVGNPSLESTQTVYQVYSRNQIKTGSPKDVRIMGISSNCFNISWTNPSYITYYIDVDAHFRIFAWKDNDKDSNLEIANSVMKRAKFFQSVKVCDLLANTKYHLMVQLKPDVSGYWSEPAEDSVTTLEDRPSIGPPMTKTSFWVGKCNDDEKRDLIIYWRGLTPLEARGFLTDYIVRFNSEEGTVKASYISINTRMSCHVTYNVEVYSTTRVGRTLNPSKLIIPSIDEAYHVPPVDVRVRKLNSSDSIDKVALNVTWTVDNATVFQGVTFVFYFCEGQTFSPKICKDDYKFKRVPFEKQFLELSNVPQEINQFGFALEKDPKSFTGISWNVCVYDGSKNPQQVTGVSVHSSGDKAGSILVVWNAQSCIKETMALVLFYHIKYCTTQSGSQKCDEKRVDGGDTSTAELQDLDTKATYTITVQAEGPDGLMGLPSETVKGSPQKFSGTGGDDAAKGNIELIAVFLGVLFLAAIIVCLKCHMKFKQRKKMIPRPKYTAFDKIAEKKNNVADKADSGISSNLTERTSLETVNNVDQLNDNYEDQYSDIACPTNDSHRKQKANTMLPSIDGLHHSKIVASDDNGYVADKRQQLTSSCDKDCTNHCDQHSSYSQMTNEWTKNNRDLSIEADIATVINHNLNAGETNSPVPCIITIPEIGFVGLSNGIVASGDNGYVDDKGQQLTNCSTDSNYMGHGGFQQMSSNSDNSYTSHSELQSPYSQMTDVLTKDSRDLTSETDTDAVTDQHFDGIKTPVPRIFTVPDNGFVGLSDIKETASTSLPLVELIQGCKTVTSDDNGYTNDKGQQLSNCSNDDSYLDHGDLQEISSSDNSHTSRGDQQSPYSHMTDILTKDIEDLTTETNTDATTNENFDEDDTNTPMPSIPGNIIEITQVDLMQGHKVVASDDNGYTDDKGQHLPNCSNDNNYMDRQYLQNTYSSCDNSYTSHSDHESPYSHMTDILTKDIEDLTTEADTDATTNENFDEDDTNTPVPCIFTVPDNGFVSQPNMFFNPSSSTVNNLGIGHSSTNDSTQHAYNIDCNEKKDQTNVNALEPVASSSGNQDDYIGEEQMVATLPPLCERKISEDEGISSPGVTLLSPNFLQTLE